MIAAEKSPLFDVLFYSYLKWMTRSRFHSVLVRGSENLASIDPNRSVLAYSNHTNWWDGLIVHLLTRTAPGFDFYCMMEEKQLMHYKFFARLGAFSVDLNSSIKAARALRYALRLLGKSGNLVWIFPQGRLASPYEPFFARPGTHFLATRSGGTDMLPVAFRYEFFREDRPVVLIEIGKPFSSIGATDERIGTSVQELMDRLEETARSRTTEGFVPLLKPRWSINKQWEWVTLAVRGKLQEFQPEN